MLAATVPLNGLTAQQALGHLQAPDGARLLITGAAGAVGSFAAQLAVQNGIRLTAQTGTGDDEWVQSLGVEHVLPREADLSSVEPFPYVLDAVPLGPAVFPAAADGATIVSTRPVDEDPGRRIHQEAMLIEWDADGLRTLIDETAAGACAPASTAWFRSPTPPTRTACPKSAVAAAKSFSFRNAPLRLARLRGWAAAATLFAGCAARERRSPRA